MKKKKRKIKLKSFIIVFAILIISALIILGYRSLHIKNIYVKGNNILKESEIISLANLDDYPNIYLVSKEDIKNNLLKNLFIKNVKVIKTFLGKITIEIEENSPLYKSNDGNYTLSDGRIYEGDKTFNVPILNNEVNIDVIDNFVNKLNLINKDILIKISEIEYQKTDLDNERFLFIMNVGNYVYVTLSKIELINSYNEIYPTLEGHKGILYLDSGNHFEIKE